jgi:hypothetical protein
VGEAIGAKALHPSPFVVDANEQVFPHCLDVGTQGRELGTAVPVATKQDDAAGERMRQPLAIDRCQLATRDVKNQWGVEGHGEVILFQR